MDERIDFKDVELKFVKLGTNAKTTLLFRLLRTCGPMIWRSCIKYCCQFLDTHNKNMDETDPLRKKYLKKSKKRKL